MGWPRFLNLGAEGTGAFEKEPQRLRRTDSRIQESVLPNRDNQRTESGKYQLLEELDGCAITIRELPKGIGKREIVACSSFVSPRQIWLIQSAGTSGFLGWAPNNASFNLIASLAGQVQ